jgi:hypothetical protein
VISFSRGPTTAGGSCQAFQANADPQFVDYQLSAASTALIDTGNPAAPLATLDIAGGPRLVDGNADCQPRRDMGADEFEPVSAACTPPVLDEGKPADAGTGTKAKKCKKKKKRKPRARGKCKKRKKKR